MREVIVNHVKATKIKRANRSLIKSPFITTYKSIDTVDRHHSNLLKTYKWLFFSDFALSLSLLTDLGILKNIETLLNT